MPKGQLWKRYRRLRWSPWFHWTYLKERFTAQLGRGPWSRRVIVGTSWLTLIVIIASLGVWTEFLVAWLIPVGLLFQRQALEQFLGEHRWEQIQNPEDSRPKVFALLSAGRFALDAPPEPTLRGAHRLAAWGRWWLKLLGEHALYRGTVVFADLAHHDEHHVHGLLTLHQRGVSLPGYAEPDSAWMNTAYGRRVYQRLKAPEDPTLRNFWDRHSPLDATFEVLSRLEPDDIGPLLRAGETANEMLGM